jgi:Flp pilus assembly protein TadG
MHAQASLPTLERLLRDRRGASAIEFASLAWVFITLVFGVLEVGQLFWTQSALQHAVEMAARCTTVNATTCGSSSAVQSFAASQAYGLSLPAATFTWSTPACGNQVTASYVYTFITAFFPTPTITLTAKSCYPK